MKSRKTDTPTGASKQNLLGHHRHTTQQITGYCITVTRNEKTKSMTDNRLVLVLNVVKPYKEHLWMKRSTTKAATEEH